MAVTNVSANDESSLSARAFSRRRMCSPPRHKLTVRAEPVCAMKCFPEADLSFILLPVVGPVGLSISGLPRRFAKKTVAGVSFCEKLWA